MNSPAPAWRRYCSITLATATVTGALLYAFVLVIDPYQNVPFAPALPRAPVDSNARYVYPGLARSAASDSLAIGNSMTRSLDPQRLSAKLDARFMNLAVSAGTAWEQHQLTQVFLRAHPQAKYLIIGLDQYWCVRGANFPRNRLHDWPYWLYDDNRWNDLFYLFNDKVLDQAVRELQYLRGRRAAKFRPDGYAEFIPAIQPTLAEVRRKIYGTRDFARAAAQPLPAMSPVLRTPTMRFPVLRLLREVLAQAGADTVKVLLFVPRPVENQRHFATHVPECKGRVVELAATIANTHVIDFMLPSAITSDDRSYWDQVHFTHPIAELVEDSLVQALGERTDRPNYYRYLTLDDVLR